MLVKMTVQTYARIAGLCFLLSLFAGGFGEGYVPAKTIVAKNAAATTDNILRHETIFRVGFAAYLVEALCDVALALLLYALLRPVHKDLSLLAAFFGVVGTAIYAVGEVAFFSMLVRNEGNLFAQLLFGYAANISMMFYGIASVLRGYLIYRSTYFPKWLGVLLMLAGCGFFTKTFLFVLTPQYTSEFLLAPMFVALIGMTLWFLVKGVDVPKWEARLARANSLQEPT